LVPGRPEVLARLGVAKRAFGSQGLDVVSAGVAANRALDAAVSRQAAVLAFERMFLLAGILFLAVLPLLFFLKAPKNVAGGPRADAHVEL
jgi:DHA2 family multidrug resistance protein